MAKHYEAVVIGAGPGGYESALHLGTSGIKTLLIDKTKERIGGTCLNEGCISSKAYLKSAHFLSKASAMRDFGIQTELGGLDMKRLKEKTASLKDELRSGVQWQLEQSGVEFLAGTARFLDPHTIDLSGETISFDKCIVATGSQVMELASLPLDGKRVLSSNEIFGLETLPSSICIIGGGLIGCEFATFFNASGVEVTMIVRSSALLGSEDEDISKVLLKAFKKRGINVLTSANLEKAEVKEKEVELLIMTDVQERISCELVLCATGRLPSTQTLDAKKAGIDHDEKGFIAVNASFQTSQKHIYAVGDCINTLAYAHTAYAEAKIAAYNILGGSLRENTHITPSAIFTDPEIASCGLSEKAAKAQGRDIEIKKAFFKTNARAKIEGDDSGFAKLVVCAQSGEILGASIVGAQATEIIHEMVLAVEKKVSYQEFKDIIHVHPSVSEIFRYL
jgi:dihydrolipoamide dehydrogenase